MGLSTMEGNYGLDMNGFPGNSFVNRECLPSVKKILNKLVLINLYFILFIL